MASHGSGLRRTWDQNSVSYTSMVKSWVMGSAWGTMNGLRFFSAACRPTRTTTSSSLWATADGAKTDESKAAAPAARMSLGLNMAGQGSQQAKGPGQSAEDVSDHSALDGSVPRRWRLARPCRR